MKLHPNAKDLTGRRFGRLVVVALAEGRKRKGLQWLCRCDCGGEKIATAADMQKGHINSCGCLFREAQARRRLKHGWSRTSTYRSWVAMRARCRPNHDYYEDYGGRGISVCEEWEHSFECFLADMGEKPSDLHEIERVDNNKGYRIDNCVWTTRKPQMRNTRANVFLTHDGKTQTLTEWAEQIGVQTGTLWRRLNKYNWPLEQALTLKPSVVRREYKSRDRLADAA